MEESPGMNLVFSIISSSSHEMSEILIARAWDSIPRERLIIIGRNMHLLLIPFL